MRVCNNSCYAVIRDKYMNPTHQQQTDFNFILTIFVS